MEYHLGRAADALAVEPRHAAVLEAVEWIEHLTGFESAAPLRGEELRPRARARARLSGSKREFGGEGKYGGAR